MDELARAQTELNQVKDIMVQNVEQILNRGERIELLIDKTDAMAGQATAFRRGARSVRREMWWRNSKILALSFIVGLVTVSYSVSLITVLTYTSHNSSSCGFWLLNSVVQVWTIADPSLKGPSDILTPIAFVYLLNSYLYSIPICCCSCIVAIIRLVVSPSSRSGLSQSLYVSQYIGSHSRHLYQLIFWFQWVES